METTLRISALFFALFVVVNFSSVGAEGKVVRIDTHAHIVPPFYYDLLIAKGLMSGGMSIPKWNPNEHIAFMDSLNIELSILSVSTPGAILTPFDDVEDSRKLARDLNEYGHMITLAYPERFQFFATLTLPDVEGSVAEAIYALDTLKAAGVALMANSLGEYLGSKKFDPLMEVLDVREATVFVHPSAVFGLASLTSDVRGEEVKVPAYMIDFLLDTTRAAASLVIRNITGRYPNIKFLLAHSGGFLPFAAYRMAGTMGNLLSEEHPEPNLKETNLMEANLMEMKKFYVDTALSSSPSAFPSTLQFFPNNQITFGTDYPYAPTPGIIDVTHSFDNYHLEDETRNHINFHCANGLFEKHLLHWRGVWHQDADTRLQ